SVIAVADSNNVRFTWSGDSKRLVYAAPPYKVMSVTIDATRELTLSTPTLAFDLKALRVNAGQWDLLPDGRLLAIQKGEGEDEPTSYRLVFNWLDELRAKAIK